MLAALLLFAACRAPSPPPAVPAVDAPPTSTCVETCTRDRQAEAVAWEVILASCEAQCLGEAPTLE